MMGLETKMRMPLRDVDMLRALLASHNWEFSDGSGVMRALRNVKTPFEVGCVRAACEAASAAFAALPAQLAVLKARHGEVTDLDAQRAMRILMLEHGADDTPYVMAQSGRGGYDNIVCEPSGTPLLPGDVLVIDTGCTVRGYWSDFDRNFIVGGAGCLAVPAAEAQDTLWRATECGFAAASKPGATAGDVFAAMITEMKVDPAEYTARARVSRSRSLTQEAPLCSISPKSVYTTRNHLASSREGERLR